jgi:hypothetical protein
VSLSEPSFEAGLEELSWLSVSCDCVVSCGFSTLGLSAVSCESGLAVSSLVDISPRVCAGQTASAQVRGLYCWRGKEQGGVD